MFYFMATSVHAIRPACLFYCNFKYKHASNCTSKPVCVCHCPERREYYGCLHDTLNGLMEQEIGMPTK